MPITGFDPYLSAQLHNQILKRAWIGAGRDVASIPSKSWWGESSPIPFDLASRLNPNLIQFLRSAKLPARLLNFRYIAPGIRLQNAIEFVDQPLADRRQNRLFPDGDGTEATPLYPLLLF